MPDTIPAAQELSFVVGSPIPNLYTLPENLKNGNLSFMYGELFYNNIQVTPLSIDVGNLTVQQERTITIFNAYTESKTLESIDVSGGDGILLVGSSRPLVIMPLTTVEFTLTIGLDGPPTIDASYLFNFTGTEDDKTVTVTGSRIVAFPFYFNTSATEVFTWNTSVLTSNDGTEQRAKLLTVPRQSFEGTAVMPYTAKALADNLLFGWRNRDWALPLWQEARLITGTVTQGTTVLNIDTEFASFAQLGLVMIWQTEFIFDVFVIQNLTTSSITLDRATETDFVNPVISPVMLSRMPSDPIRSTNGNNGFITATFESRDNTEIDSSPTPTQFLGYDVNEIEALLVGEFVEDTYHTRIDIIDFMTGSLEYDSPWNITKTARAFRVVLEGQQEIWEFKQWLHRRSGRWRPFWMDTREPSFTLIDKGTIGGTFFAINEGQATQGSNKMHITVAYKDGTFLYTTILSKAINEDNEVVIGVQDGINATVDEIDYISYLGLKRLASDSITITRFGNNVGECIIPILEIES